MTTQTMTVKKVNPNTTWLNTAWATIAEGVRQAAYEHPFLLIGIVLLACAVDVVVVLGLG